MMTIRRMIRGVVGRLRTTSVAIVAARAVDSIALSVWRWTHSVTERQGTVVLSTIGGGNIGDQAMLDAVVRGVQGPVIVLTPTSQSFLTVPPEVEARMLSIPALADGKLLGRSRARWRFIDFVARARLFVVIGADIMDGTYELSEAIQRFELLELASTAGASARAVGFSWSDHASPNAVRAAIRASRRAELCVRDPLSAARMRHAGIERVHEVADVVFSSPLVSAPSKEAVWLRGQSAAGRRVAIINVSGLLSARHPLHIEQMERVASRLVAQGFALLLVPHVIRSGDDDLWACSALKSRFEDDAPIRIVDRLLRPSEVAGVCSAADIVVTGRMHLAIISLSVGVPPVIVGSQGKVQGLLQLFGVPWLEVQPSTDSFVDDVLSAVDRVRSDPEARRNVVGALPSVRALAEQNFAGEADDGLPRRLLWVTPFSPLRQHDHAASDIGPHLLERLSKDYEVLVYAAGERRSVDPDRNWEVADSAPRRKVNGLRRLAPYPLRLRGAWSALDTLQVARLARVFQPDHLHVEYLQPAEVLWKVAGRRGAMSTSITLHDVTEVVLKQEARKLRGIRGVYRRLEAALVGRVERKAIRKAAAVIAFSAEDAKAVNDRRGENVHVARLGVGRPDRSWDALELHSGPPVILFAGAMWRAANELSARFLVESVMPLVWANHPQAILRIVGSRPSDWLIDQGLTESRIQVVGRVDDFDDEFLAANVVVCPSIVEAGVLLKALRALSLGCPVVLNHASARPMPGIQHGVQALVADTPADHAHAIDVLLSDPGYSGRLGNAGRLFISTHFNWDECAQVYAAAIDSGGV